MNKEEYGERLSKLLQEKAKKIRFHTERILQQFANEALAIQNDFLKSGGAP